MIRSPWLADYSWPEVEALVASEVANLLLMLGATEQHGPHLPLATDTIIAEALGMALAAELGATLIAPIIPIGSSDEHLEFAGTLSLAHTTLAAIIADVGCSAARHGFRRLLIFSAHGGNYAAISAAVAALAGCAPALEVVAITTLEAALALAEPPGTVPPELAGLHAGEYETSQMLFLRPNLVQMQHAEAGYTGAIEAVLPQLYAQGLRPVTPNGVLGDPTIAAAERGQAYVEQQAHALAHFVRKAL